ncbi:MAG: glycosyltransferase family 9 protein [Flavobacteriales bacterium]|nr:glycosyltransferase family 9 protein [Flavobacteriales bacterium]
MIDMVVRKGNEGLLEEHPFIRKVYVWDKKQAKFRSLARTIREIRKTRYDRVINLQRFLSSGIMTLRARTDSRAGFDKNPLSFTFSTRIHHVIGDGRHETERNHALISDLTGPEVSKPKLYINEEHLQEVAPLKKHPYLCMAPASVWFTKQLPAEQWIRLIRACNPKTIIYMLGAPSDAALCDEIIRKSGHNNLVNMAGKLSFLGSAALMHDAEMNYVNDSAPLHLASAVNARVTSFFCSTTPRFGFGPLSTYSIIAEATPQPECKPCGLHGLGKCPKKHFRCALDIPVAQFAFTA